MTQNRSAAVMSQRVEPDDSLEDFPTPPYATRALLTHVFDPHTFGEMTVWDPACNRGFMAKPLGEFFGTVLATDILDYGWPGHQDTADFLFPTTKPSEPVDYVITNPPFRLAEEFIERSLGIARVGCAMLVRTQFLEGQDRFKRLYERNPPTATAIFSERVIMHKGVLRDPSIMFWDTEMRRPGQPTNDPPAGSWRRPSTATSYCWMVWIKGAERQPTDWIPPCRRELERPGDYPVNPDQRGVFVPPSI